MDYKTRRKELLARLDWVINALRADAASADAKAAAAILVEDIRQLPGGQNAEKLLSVTDAVARAFRVDTVRPVVLNPGGESVDVFCVTAAAWSQAGVVCSCEEYHHRLAFYDPSKPFVARQGTFSIFPGGFRYPSSVTAVSDRSFIVIDRWNCRMTAFAPDGTRLGIIGGPGDSTEKFWNPTSVSADGEDTVWVCDAGNRRLQRFQVNGEGNTVPEPVLVVDLTDTGALPSKVTASGELVFVTDETLCNYYRVLPNGNIDRVEFCINGRAVSGEIVAMAGCGLCVVDVTERRAHLFDGRTLSHVFSFSINAPEYAEQSYAKFCTESFGGYLAVLAAPASGCFLRYAFSSQIPLDSVLMLSSDLY